MELCSIPVRIPQSNPTCILQDGSTPSAVCDVSDGELDDASSSWLADTQTHIAGLLHQPTWFLAPTYLDQLHRNNEEYWRDVSQIYVMLLVWSLPDKKKHIFLVVVPDIFGFTSNLFLTP